MAANNSRKPTETPKPNPNDTNNNGIPDYQELLAGNYSFTTQGSSDPDIFVPAWIYDTVTGSKTVGPVKIVRKPGERQQRMTTPAPPQKIKKSQIENFVELLSASGNSKALNRLSKFLTGKTGVKADVLSYIWGRALNYSDMLGMSVKDVVTNKGLAPFVLGDAAGIVGGGSAGPQRYVSLTTAETANRDLLSYMAQTLGRKPTDAEYKDYLSKLNAAERKNPTIVRQTASGGSTTLESGFSRELFLRDYVLAKADWAKDLKGGVGATQDHIDQYLSAYGLTGVATKNMKIDLMRKYAKGEIDDTTLKASLRDLAAKTYTAFADQLKADPEATLKDIAAPLVSVYSNMMEVDPNTVDMKDVLSKATGPDGKPLSAFDYAKVVRKDPRYQFTGNAHQEAASFGRAFAQSMGVNL